MEKEIGKVTHFFTKISVGVIELKDAVKEGDTIHIKGATTDFKQKASSMQVEHKKVEKAGKGKSIGLKVKDHVRQGDIVYKVEAEAKAKTSIKKAPAKKKAAKKKK